MTEELVIRKEGIEELYDIGEEIGSGQFAVVKKLLEKSTDQVFAAKFMKKKRSKSSRRGMTSEQILREASVLRSVNHKGIIYLHDIFESKLEFVLVLELLSGGELFEFLSEQEYLTEDEAVGFLKQVIEAIEYLHQNSIVHLDIKPENIVLKCEGSNQIKLIDFGLARKLTKGEMVREIMGTPEFVAPEIIAFEPVGSETDMWAIGVLTYIMLSGASPFLGDDDNETFNNISHVDYEFDEEYFKDISSPAKEFISHLLLKNPRDRMNAGGCLKHEWMQEQNSSGESEEDDVVCDNLPSVKNPSTKSELKTRRSTLIKTEAFKKFTARARWQKSVNKLIAISRLALLGKKTGPLSKGVMLQPNESETSSDTENNNDVPPVSLVKLDDSDRESTGTIEDESINSTDSAKPESKRSALNEEDEMCIARTGNGVPSGEVKGERCINEERSDSNDHKLEIRSALSNNDVESKSVLVKNRSLFEHESSTNEKSFDIQRGKEKTVGERESKIDKKFKNVQPDDEKADEIDKKEREKRVVSEVKPIKHVLESSVDATIGNGAKSYVSDPKNEVASEQRQIHVKKTNDDVIQKSSKSTTKSSDYNIDKKQEDLKSKSFKVSRDRVSEESKVRKSEFTKMRPGKFESLLSKFTKSSTISEDDSKKKKNIKEIRRMTSESVRNRGKFNDDEGEEHRTRRKSDQLSSRIDLQGTRMREERLKTEPLKSFQAQPGLVPSSQSVSEQTGRIAKQPFGRMERCKSPSTIKREIRTTTSTKSSADAIDSIWVRRSTTSKVEEKSRDSRSNRRRVLGLSATSAKAKVMEWEQRSNSVRSSSRMTTSSPLSSTRDITRPDITERPKTETAKHNTTVTVNTKNNRIPCGEESGMGSAVKDEEHTLLIQTSLPVRNIDELETPRDVNKPGRDPKTVAHYEKGHVNHSVKESEDTKPTVENTGKESHVVENSKRSTKKAEVINSKSKRTQERTEGKIEIKDEKQSIFPEFALTFQKITPAANNDDDDVFSKDDDMVWVMTSETNPNIEFLTGVLAPKVKASTKSKPSSSKTHTRESRTWSARVTSLSELDKECVGFVDNGQEDSASSEVKSTRLEEPSETTQKTHTVQLKSTMTTVNFEIKTDGLKLSDPKLN